MRALAAVLVLTILAVAPTAAQPYEIVFWQSIVTSTNPADFEAYLEEFPDGVFRRLWRRTGSPRWQRPCRAETRVSAALATCSGTARSARRWWCCRAVSWRWADTR